MNVDASGAVSRSERLAPAVCRSVLDGSDPNCVPYDVVRRRPVGRGDQLPERLRRHPGQHVGADRATSTSPACLAIWAVKTPWAEDGVGINVGVEYRKESLDLNPDQSFQTGDLAGQGAPTLPVSGNFRVWDVFGEAQIPIIQHNFIDELIVSARLPEILVRASSSGRNYDTDTYKISAEFAPIRDIRFRGSYNRAVRAPNIQELFAPQFVGLDGSNDPCAKVITRHRLRLSRPGPRRRSVADCEPGRPVQRPARR